MIAFYSMVHAHTVTVQIGINTHQLVLTQLLMKMYCCREVTMAKLQIYKLALVNATTMVNVPRGSNVINVRMVKPFLVVQVVAKKKIGIIVTILLGEIVRR